MIGSLKAAVLAPLTASKAPARSAGVAAAETSTVPGDAVQLSGTTETAAAAPVKSKLSTGAKGALLAAGLATAMMAAAPASAQPWGYGGYGGGYGGYHHHHNGGGNAGAAIGGLIIGTIIGGAIAGSQREQPPVIYQQAPPVYGGPVYGVPVREPYRAPNGALVCPDAAGSWYVSPNPYRCY